MIIWHGVVSQMFGVLVVAATLCFVNTVCYLALSGFPIFLFRSLEGK